MKHNELNIQHRQNPAHVEVTLQTMPHFDSIRKISQLSGIDFTSKISIAIELESSPYFTDEYASLHSNILVYAKIQTYQRNQKGQLELLFKPNICPIDFRAKQAFHSSIKSSALKKALRILRKNEKRTALEKELIRIPSRGNAHFAITKIKQLSWQLEEVITELCKTIENSISNMKVPKEYEALSRAHQVMTAQIINWRVKLDALSIEGGEIIPIEFTPKDIDFYCSSLLKEKLRLNELHFRQNSLSASRLNK